MPKYGSGVHKEPRFWDQLIFYLIARGNLRLDVKVFVVGGGHKVVQATVSVSKAIEPEEDMLMVTDTKPTSDISKSTSSSASNNTSAIAKKPRNTMSESKKGHSYLMIQRCFDGKIQKATETTLKNPHVRVMHELSYLEDPVAEMQVSFGSSSKVKALQVTIEGTQVTLSGTRRPCNGVKRCGQHGCEVQISTNRKQCKEHPAAKPVSWCDDACPVSLFVLEAPGDTSKKWVGLFTSTSKQAHNHPESPDFKIGKAAQQLITDFVVAHPEATPSETVRKLSTPLGLSSGVGIDVEMVASVRKKALSDIIGDTSTGGLKSVNEYLLEKFKKETKEAGQTCECEILTGLSLEGREQIADGENNATKLGIFLFPYLRSITRHENGFTMWTCAIPLLVGELAKAKEWQIDATYNEMTRENGKTSYLLNINSFSPITLRWITPVRIRLNAKTETAYVLAFKALRQVLGEDCPEFSASSLECVLFDFEVCMSTAFSRVFGEDVSNVIKGCNVHWQRSAKAQGDKVCEGRDEKGLWWLLTKKVLDVRTREDFLALFDALCGGDLDPIRHLLDDVDKYQKLSCTNWHKSKNWAKFFTNTRVAKMLNQKANGVSPTPGSTSTNAAESMNNLVKDGTSRPPVLATIFAHELDLRLAHEVFMVNGGGQRALRANSPAKRMLASAGRGKEISELSSDLRALSSPAASASALDSDNEDDYWGKVSKTPESEVQAGERSQTGTSISRTRV